MTGDEFWQFVDRSGGEDACWPWLAGRDANGYAVVWWQGKRERSHRVALLLDGRPVGPGLKGRHLCGANKVCCNPKHLAPGTTKDNYDDWVKDGARRRPAVSKERRDEAVGWYVRGLATSGELATLLGVAPERIRHWVTDWRRKQRA